MRQISLAERSSADYGEAGEIALFLRIENLLSVEQVDEISGQLASAPFVAGGATAGPAASAVKNNEQLDSEAFGDTEKLDQIILNALGRSAHFCMAVLPARILPPLYSRYRESMTYGPHIDNPFISQRGGTVRSDVSMTVFLNSPEDYDGGELVVRTAAGEAKAKLPKGDAVVYTTAEVHQVLPVTRGVRLCAVTWAQSLVAGEERRKVLCDLDVAIQSLRMKHPEAGELDDLVRTYGNLLRMWGAP